MKPVLAMASILKCMILFNSPNASAMWTVFETMSPNRGATRSLLHQKIDIVDP